MHASELIKLDEETFYEEHVIWVDHRACEDELIEEIAETLNLNLNLDWQGDTLQVTYREKHFVIPLTLTRHDRYVALSSVAELLKGEYTFWLLSAHQHDDTHGLFIVDRKTAEELKSRYANWSQQHLVLMQLGYDYFNGIDVPYLHHENNNPHFKQEALEVEQHLQSVKTEFEQIVKNDPVMQQTMQNLRNDISALNGSDSNNNGLNNVTMYCFAAFVVLANMLLQVLNVEFQVDKSTAYNSGKVLGAAIAGVSVPFLIYFITQAFPNNRKAGKKIKIFITVCLIALLLKLIRLLGS